jgi:hypothetical protein
MARVFIRPQGYPPPVDGATLMPPMTEDRLIPVSPRHRVRLASEYLGLVERAPERDYVVRTIVRREANGLPLMAAEIVIAGRDTRALYPLAERYPLHFRKTYFAARLHGDLAHEFGVTERASKLVGAVPPIGHTADVFRACLVPGVPYSRLSPFGVEPEDANIRRATELSVAAAAGLWRFVEEAFAALRALHAAGIAHGDAELHNFVVCASPLEVVVIDFEAAVLAEGLDAAAWQKRCALDLAPVLREAIFLQCALGPQAGALAEASLAAAETLFAAPERFRRAIERKADLS